MKRSAIKPNRKRTRDTTESLAVREQHRIDNPVCEITRFLRVGFIGVNTLTVASMWERSLGLRFDHRSVAVHHIAIGNRVDVVSNLITVEAAWHDWIHANPTVGTLLCLLVKQSKGEINAAEWRECSGYELAGWLSLDKVVSACPEWLNSRRVALIESLGE